MRWHHFPPVSATFHHDVPRAFNIVENQIGLSMNAYECLTFNGALKYVLGLSILVVVVVVAVVPKRL